MQRHPDICHPSYLPIGVIPENFIAYSLFLRNRTLHNASCILYESHLTPTEIDMVEQRLRHIGESIKQGDILMSGFLANYFVR